MTGRAEIEFLMGTNQLQYIVAVRVYGTVPTNTVPVQMTTGTVTDSGSVWTGLLRDSSELIYRAGKL